MKKIKRRIEGFWYDDDTFWFDFENVTSLSELFTFLKMCKREAKKRLKAHEGGTDGNGS